MNGSKHIVSRLLYHRPLWISTSSASPITSVLRFYATKSRFHRLTCGTSKSFLKSGSVSVPAPLRAINTSGTTVFNAEQLKSHPEAEEHGVSNSNEAQTGEQSPSHTDDELEHITLTLTPEQIQELTKGDEELIRKIKLIQMEHELARQDGARVPPNPIKLKKWKELLELRSRGQRMKYFNYLWNCQMGDESIKRKKLEQREKRAAEISALPPLPTPEEDPHGLFYGLGRNTLFLRLYDSSLNRFHHGRMVSASLFNQTLVIDCGYDEHMTRAEAKNCAGQLEYFFTDNRSRAKEPLNLILCNVDKKTKFMEALHTRIPTLYEDSYMLQIFEESYIDLFPRERLVYLTPHARDDLMEHNEDDVYIVGAMVDKHDPRPFSMAKAKRDGVRTAKLPLDQYLDWGGGSGKSLTVNQMGSILIDFSNTKDWAHALRHVPTRKLRRPDESIPSDRFILEQPKRKERKSQVLRDFEQETSRTGFGFKGSRGQAPFTAQLNRERFRPNLKSILQDD